MREGGRGKGGRERGGGSEGREGGSEGREGKGREGQGSKQQVLRERERERESVCVCVDQSREAGKWSHKPQVVVSHYQGRPQYKQEGRGMPHKVISSYLKTTTSSTARSAKPLYKPKNMAKGD